MAKMAKAQSAALSHHEALPRPDGKQVSVVHCRRARRGVGEEGLPRTCAPAPAMEKLWEAILVHLPRDGRPHRRVGGAQRRTCTTAALISTACTSASLHYTAANGTDFTVGMIPEGEFKRRRETPACRASSSTPTSRRRSASSPPSAGEAEGIVYATQAPELSGPAHREFLRSASKRARPWRCNAEKNEELLKSMIAMDEGASYLGECALVP